MKVKWYGELLQQSGNFQVANTILQTKVHQYYLINGLIRLWVEEFDQAKIITHIVDHKNLFPISKSIVCSSFFLIFAGEISVKFLFGKFSCFLSIFAHYFCFVFVLLFYRFRFLNKCPLCDYGLSQFDWM